MSDLEQREYEDFVSGWGSGSERSGWYFGILVVCGLCAMLISASLEKDAMIPDNKVVVSPYFQVCALPTEDGG